MSLEPIRCPRCRKAFVYGASETLAEGDGVFLCHACDHEFSKINAYGRTVAQNHDPIGGNDLINGYDLINGKDTNNSDRLAKSDRFINSDRIVDGEFAKSLSGRAPFPTQRATQRATQLPTQRAIQLEPSIPCPYCGGEIRSHSDECPSCLRIPSKFQYTQLKGQLGDLSETTYRALMALWKEVIERFDEPEAHQRFLRAVEETQQWDFASEKYAHLESLIGYDPEIEKRQNQIKIEKLKRQEKIEALQQKELRKKMLYQLLLFIAGALLILVALNGPRGSVVFLLGGLLFLVGLLYGIQK